MNGIPDFWPECACKGGSPQMLEHNVTHCSVLPTIVIEAVDADRPLTPAEFDAVKEAAARRALRGYRAATSVQELLDRMGVPTPELRSLTGEAPPQ